MLLKLPTIQALFNPNPQDDGFDDNFDLTQPQRPHFVKVDVYPLGFLKTAGNIQAGGVPHCFYPTIARINGKVRRVRDNVEFFDANDSTSGSDSDGDPGDGSRHFQGPLVLKPVSSQFYNLITHRAASRAGKHDSQKGTVTAALAGAFSQTLPHKAIASDKKLNCDISLPSERFHDRISGDDCPRSCRAELVYSVNVRALKKPTGRYAHIFPLPRCCRANGV